MLGFSCSFVFFPILDINIFPAKIDPRVLIRLSPFSDWLVREFCVRCGVSSVYEQVTFLKFSVISIPMQPNLANFILAHLLLRQLLNVFKDPRTLCNKGEVRVIDFLRFFLF